MLFLRPKVAVIINLSYERGNDKVGFDGIALLYPPLTLLLKQIHFTKNLI